MNWLRQGPRLGGRAMIALGLSVTAMPATAQTALVITIAGPASRGARADLSKDVVPAVITVGLASDIVGNPVRFSRTTFSRLPDVPAQLSITRPAGLPMAGTLTSGFGMRSHPLLGIRREHQGIDLAAPTGTPIRATADGIVGRAAWAGGYGLLVEVDSGGTQTRFGHMSRLAVSTGQSVKKGDVIGYVGATGLATGSHLHYEVRENGRAVNPLLGF